MKGFLLSSCNVYGTNNQNSNKPTFNQNSSFKIRFSEKILDFVTVLSAVSDGESA
jgi:hypothetical protein